MASLVEAQTPADEWLVIETTYHSSYGCYRGRRWSRAERICQDLVRVVGPFETREAAVEAAGGVRDSNEMFDDDEAGRYAGEPPWDSADASNYDNDDEVRVEVKTVAAHEAQLRDDEQHMAEASVLRP